MSEVTKKTKRLSKVAREFNLGIQTIVDYLKKKGYVVDANPNTKVSEEQYTLLLKEYSSEIKVKKESEKVSSRISRERKEALSIDDVRKESDEGDYEAGDSEDQVLIKETSGKKPASPEKSPEKAEKPEEEKEKPTGKREADEEKEVQAEEKQKEEESTSNIKIVGSIDLESVQKKPARQKKEAKEEPAAGSGEEEPVPEKKAEKPEKKAEKPAPEKKTEKSEKKAEKPVSETKKEKPSEEETKKQKSDTVSAATDQGVDEKKKSPEKPSEEKKESPEKTVEEKKKTPEKTPEDVYKPEIEKLSGVRVVGKIDLPSQEEKKKGETSGQEQSKPKKKRRKRIRKDDRKVSVEGKEQKKEQQKKTRDEAPKKKSKKKSKPVRPEISEEDVQKQIKDTLSRLTSKGKSKGSKYRKEKREQISEKQREDAQKQEKEKNVLKVTEFVTVNELANMMDVQATDVISSCMSLGLFVSINQRLDAETISLVAEEYGYKTEFISVELQDDVVEEEDDPENLEPRPPIVTVMGHVDHGKTSLLDFIRHANVIGGEAGGITQHIGAYGVTIENGKNITFLDTPGHEAFTAMRARGAKITDVAIIVIAADDSVMPQTVEAINHAHAAGVPIVFAINKIDKPNASTDKIREQLANMNFLTEDWGGKYQVQEISAKQGKNIEELLEKVLLEAEMLELKANPNRKASGTIVESSLDKGRGYVATVLVQNGTLKVGDLVLSGKYYGHVKAMYNERGKRISEVGPSSPALILGLNGAPQAGENFNVMTSDREVKELANKREQLEREQGLRAQKHITLDEIGRRIAIGNFQELNIIIKGDVDGSVEALADAISKLSTEQIQVRIIHKAVGQISESDILLAAASNAVVLGFQVRPSMSARKLAEKEEIDIRIYSIIYDAVNEIKSAMEGMLKPEIKEEVVATLEIREVFKISKVGRGAGCFVKDGKIDRNSKVRVIRDGIVVYTGKLGSLKRFKEDVREVSAGYECGLNIENFNDIKVGDIIEACKEVEVKKTLE